MRRIDYRSIDMHPAGAAQFRLLETKLRGRVYEQKGKRFVLIPFEGIRTADRQNYLLTVEKTTKARAWQSAHQYGLAVDFAAMWVGVSGAINPDTWFWPESSHPCWRELKTLARQMGMDVPIANDLGHVQHPLFVTLRTVIDRDQDAREWNWIA